MQPFSGMLTSVPDSAAASAHARTVAALADDDARDRADLLDRLDLWYPDLAGPLSEIYPGSTVINDVIDSIVAGHLARPAKLRTRDRQRLLTPDWFQRPDAIGYATYADRFAGTLKGVATHIDYLRELGITYLHLLPLLAPREGPNDGGYAVIDYRKVRPDLGTMQDLADLADQLHDNGIALTLDLVINHVAYEHEWARRARNGETRYRNYFWMFADRSEPDAYEQTLPEVFPDFAPGNFTWDDQSAAWVWTTFNSYQWDLDWRNPHVLVEFVDTILYLANQGVDCLRMDAIAFIWKRLGTNCQNQPEVHAITQALRTAVRICAPAVIFKAEAIVGPDDVGAYLGQGKHAGKVSDLAYHNTLMVQTWSALATGDTRLASAVVNRFPTKPVTTAWATYVRCHDDIGWAIDDQDAANVGWNGFDHRRFLADFYVGEFPGSFARGALFQDNPDTGDRRNSGSAASLVGVEAAAEHDSDRGADANQDELNLALARMYCIHALMYGFGGLPLLNMGDELGLTNDYNFSAEPAHAEDNRWLHRPKMPWDRAELRKDPTSVEGRIFAGITHLARVRASLDSLHASIDTECVFTDNASVLVTLRRHAAGNLVGLYNTSAHWQSIPSSVAHEVGLSNPVDALSDHPPQETDGRFVLAPYAAAWLVQSTSA